MPVRQHEDSEDADQPPRDLTDEDRARLNLSRTVIRAPFAGTVSELTLSVGHLLGVGEVICSHRNDKPLNRLYTVGEGFTMAGLPRG